MDGRAIFDLSGKVALVTAGGHGLGREYCVAMAQFGADVVLNDIREDLARETAELVRQCGRRACVAAGDVSLLDAVNTMVRRALEEFGTIDILFCNAGIMNDLVPLHELAVESWNHVVATNLTSTFLCMRAVLPIMLKKRSGSIIVTSSVSGFRAIATPEVAHCYGATKAGMISLMKHAAVAYAKHGIRVNAIAPGLHDTKPVGWKLTEEDVRRLNDTIIPIIPMGRLAQPCEIKGLAVFLASEASSYVTGQVFVSDGGASA